MGVSNLYLTAFRPTRKGILGATIEPFDAGELRSLIGENVIVLAGPAQSPAPTQLLHRLNEAGLPGAPAAKGRHKAWVLVTRNPETLRLQRHKFPSAQKMLRRFTPRAIESAGQTVAFLPQPVFEELDDLAIGQLFSEAAPTPQAHKIESRNRDRLLDARESLLDRVPSYSSEDLASLRTSTTSNPSQLGQDLRKAGKVIAVRHGKSWYYPKFQFGGKGIPDPSMALVVAALGSQADPWDVLQWFVEPNEFLQRDTPLKRWAKDRDSVIEAARGAHWFARD